MQINNIVFKEIEMLNEIGNALGRVEYEMKKFGETLYTSRGPI